MKIEGDKVEELEKIMGESLEELKSMEKETKSNKDSKSTGTLIDGLEDGLKNLFN